MFLVRRNFWQGASGPGLVVVEHISLIETFSADDFLIRYPMEHIFLGVGYPRTYRFGIFLLLTHDVSSLIFIFGVFLPICVCLSLY